MRLSPNALCRLPSWLFVSATLVGPLVSAADPATHWAFLPVPAVQPPSLPSTAWTRTPVDAFVLKRLEEAGLEPSGPASRETLIRRVFVDLTGLPPSPAEVDAFVHDSNPDAFGRVVDRLLDSPAYGERWARHWLDLARFAESDGFEHDAVRPHSWRYRDYVVRGFNNDTPFDRFIREQLAGDELWPDEPAALIATGFNLLGPDMVDSADQVQRRLNTLNDMTDTTAAVFLGLTLGCARCHDHKSEPFTQRDYFSLQAFFASADFQRERRVPTTSERAAHISAMAEYDARTSGWRKSIEKLEAPYREQLFDGKLAKLSEDAQLAYRTPRERRTPEQEGTVQETAPQVKVTDAEVAAALSAEDRARRAELEAELKKIPRPTALPLAMVVVNTNGPAPPTQILARGDYNNPRETVQPDVPEILARSRSPGPDSTAGVSPSGPHRRSALAAWIASPDNPLTARVMVNRIWQHHFGRGLVGTPNDFGTRGEAPSHPELLDWLAGEFIGHGWSVKHLHRVILLSSTYQQSSTASPQALERDRENRLLSRQNRIRLEGEALRDSLLAISGQLNSEMGGPGIFPPIPADITRVSKNWTASATAADHSRRSLYIFARRNLRFPFLEVFDAPDSNLSCPERGRSTTAPQALSLLNSDEVMAAARATADSLAREANTPEEQINAAYRRILGRRPTASESAASREFLATSPLVELCRALFNLNAFVYAE
ncbi:MAG TPA: DUF1553 domain-containing protein [Verrucomicrobiota bacterium]|nr:DUF1553 domain-containing protein [Verrucomicrobiota bacterium]